MANINEVIRAAMAEFGYDRDKVVAALIRRKGDDDLNDTFRVRGIQNSVASFQSAMRHDVGERPAIAPRRATPNMSPAVKASIEAHRQSLSDRAGPAQFWRTMHKTKPGRPISTLADRMSQDEARHMRLAKGQSVARALHSPADRDTAAEIAHWDRHIYRETF